MIANEEQNGHFVTSSDLVIKFSNVFLFISLWKFIIVGRSWLKIKVSLADEIEIEFSCQGSLF